MDTLDEDVAETKIIDGLIANNPKIKAATDLDPVEFESNKKRKNFNEDNGNDDIIKNTSIKKNDQDKDNSNI